MIKQTPEERYVELLTGGSNSPLLTDGYKFSMAQAGAPLRPETFYLSFRHGDPLLVPFDFAEVIRLLRPRLPNTKELGFLAANGYSMSSAMETALQAPLQVHAVPAGSWVAPSEPVLHLSTASFLASWLESLTIAFNFPMQIATAIYNGQRQFDATCEVEAVIIRLVASTLDVHALADDLYVTVCEAEYIDAVADRGRSIIEAVGGDIDRVFECGTRAMTCLQNHRIALTALQGLGITRTANVLLAYELYMIPVGTTGHEHQQRWLNDEDGFRAIRDMRPEPPSYLFDTYDVFKSGIPAAIEVMREDLGRRQSVRFDRDDHKAQMDKFEEAQSEMRANLFYILMDGYTAERTLEMEAHCDSHGIARADRLYGFGGYFVCAADWMLYTRNKVAAVYKLCRTGPNDVMKFAGSKSSVPGLPIILRTPEGSSMNAQLGEGVPGYFPLADLVRGTRPVGTPTYSRQTQRLIAICEARKETR